MSSAADLKLLTSDEWRERTSDSIAKAVASFIKETKGR
jgi:N-acetylmuramoyl-L-alanine amidase